MRRGKSPALIHYTLLNCSMAAFLSIIAGFACRYCGSPHHWSANCDGSGAGGGDEPEVLHEPQRLQRAKRPKGAHFAMIPGRGNQVNTVGGMYGFRAGLSAR